MITVIHAHENHFESRWSEGLQNIPGATPMYSPSLRAFDLEIFSSSLEHDDSFVVMHSDTVVALVPLYRLKGDDGIIEYRYGGEYVRAPLVGYSKSDKVYGKIVQFVFEYIASLAEKYSVLSHMTMIEGVELIEGRNYHNYLTELAYVDDSTICQLIDLKKSEDELWSNVRKSYRPLINRAKKNYSYEVIISSNFDEQKCEEYRILHHKVAGRQTRSLKSFQLMYESIKNDQGFLVIVRNENEKTTAAHFFFYFGLYCVYGSSAIDDHEPSNAGIGQLGVWMGIITAQNLGCHYFDMGQLRLTNNPSKKEQNIAQFKKGFGGRTVTVFRGKKKFKNEAI